MSNSFLLLLVHDDWDSNYILKVDGIQWDVTVHRRNANSCETSLFCMETTQKYFGVCFFLRDFEAFLLMARHNIIFYFYRKIIDFHINKQTVSESYVGIYKSVKTDIKPFKIRSLLVK